MKPLYSIASGAAWVLGCALMACGGSSASQDHDAGASADAASDGGASARVQLNLLYVHGLKNCDSDRQDAEDSLVDLEQAMNDELPALIAAYQDAHPGVTVVTASARANLYTAEPSGYQPPGADPLAMDDWEVGADGCATSEQGDRCTTAYEWRYRLAREIERLFPPDAKNIILIGHSTGVRVSFEVAANVGVDGVGSHDWGVADRIAGVVGIHGMVDALDSDQYDMIGPLGFVTTCKLGDLVSGIGGLCTPGKGWCEYGGYLSGLDAADWVAAEKHALTLVSHHSCSPSTFGGQTDGALPLAAQASPMAPGLVMTPAPGQRQQPASGRQYGSFCHSAIDTRSNELHDQAVTAAKEHILTWLFSRAERVVEFRSLDTPPVDYGGATASYDMGAAGCLPGHGDGPVEVTGVCKHPGLFDGDDHAIDPAELTVEDGAACAGSFSWTQAHDPGNSREASMFWKTYATLPGAGVIDSLARD